MSEAEIRMANDQFYQALNAMLKGDMGPMRSVWSHSSDVSNMGPFGGRLVGAQAVLWQFEKEANMKLGGRVVAIDVRIVAGTDLGYTTCVERGESMSAAGQPIEVEFRATNVFRRENNAWKLVHHHTDLSAALQKAAQ
jgi:ketosteroid isomerase-like protein